MALNAELKLLESGTLSTLYSQLFQACENEAIDINQFAPDNLVRVTEARRNISEFNALKPSVTGESIKSKAIAAAEIVQRKVKEQGLKSELEAQQSEAGKLLYAKFKQNDYSARKVCEITAQIDIGEKKKADITAKIGTVTQELPRYLRNPKYTAIGVAAVIAILFCSYKFYEWHNAPVRVSQRRIEQAQRDNQRGVQTSFCKFIPSHSVEWSRA